MAKFQQPIAENSHQETYEEPDEFDLLLAEQAIEIMETNDEWIPHNEAVRSRIL
ncbi:MAG: hypothetical protein K0U45_08655 [Alphaproteobacteria bacterium]|nr:hypothetical protein [Alphaproteobacteria bacterium]